MLPKAIEAADSEWLADALASHLEQTKTHVAAVAGLFAAVEAEPVAAASPALVGLRKEHDETIDSIREPRLRDIYLAGAGARVEHLELALYAWLELLADRLSLGDGELKRIRGEEADALKTLEQTAARLGER